MKKLDYVDALRGLAVLLVIMVHTSQYGNFDMPKLFAQMIGLGARGVQLFFIASAFTLFLSFKTRLKKEQSPIRNFFLRRFFRIAPLYYLGICYYLFQDGLGPRYWLGDETQITNLNIISNFTFLHGFNPYWITSIVPGGWSIAIEMMFYVILPFLYFRVKSVKQAFNFFVLSMLLNTLLQLFFTKFKLITDTNLWNNYLFFYFPSQLPIFCLGIILYFLVIEKESLKNISKFAIVIFLGLIFIRLSSGIKLVFPNHIFFGIGFLILGLLLSKYQLRIIVNRMICFFGKISYSMYLVHFAVLYWLTQYNYIDYSENGIINYIIRFSLVVFLTSLISIFLYKIIEIPFQDLGKKLINRLERIK